MSPRRISAQKLIADIKSKVTYGCLMDRYSLSEADLDGVFQELVDSGLLKREELPDKGNVSETCSSLGPHADRRAEETAPVQAFGM